MPTKFLPERPDLDQLKRQAKELRKAHAAGSPAALQRLREFHPRFAGASDVTIVTSALSLADAQLAIAREYGFASWPRLKAQIEAGIAQRIRLPQHERIEDPVFRRAVDLIDAGDAAGLRALLDAHPGLARRRVEFEGGNYFRNPALIEFCAENPTRRGTLPSNIVGIVRVLLDAGARDDPAALDSTLALVASGRVPRERGVQVPLIGLLCDAGARPDEGMMPALLHGEHEAAEALVRRGAKQGFLLAVARGREGEARRLLPGADEVERQRALMLAAQEGHVGILDMLLDAGADPDRFNPPWGHSHATPLHVAVAARKIAVVRLLVERGARLDIRDIHWNGTPLDWAEHERFPEIVEFLRAARGS